jgi:hypothetical protein
MKIVGKYIKHLFDRKNHAELTFKITNYRHCAYLDELDCEKDYSIEIKEVKSARSLEQNRFLWALLHALEIKTRELAMDWYVKALTDTGAKVDYVWGTEDTEHTLKQSFRSVQRVKPYQIKETQGWLYRVIVGSSKFNIQEMNELLDTVIRYCNELGIETEEYRYES